MTAAIYQFDGRDSFTRRAGSEPAWHGLGGETPIDAPIEIWAKNAGMDFTIQSAPVQFALPTGEISQFPDRCALYRSDNGAPLGLVSGRYKVVQPHDVLAFFRDLANAGGYQLETAGVLCDGGKYWGLATNGTSEALSGDVVKPYLLLATACDGTLATTAMHTAVRVVCQNTINMALGATSDAIKVRHSTVFDPRAVRTQLGIDDSFNAFMSTADRLASRALSDSAAAETIWTLFGDHSKPRTERDQSAQTKKKIESVWSLYKGRADGATLPSARGTAWGLLNAVTQYVDHDARARSAENRLHSAWFGPGNATKSRALELLAA